MTDLPVTDLPVADLFMLLVDIALSFSTTVSYFLLPNLPIRSPTKFNGFHSLFFSSVDPRCLRVLDFIKGTLFSLSLILSSLLMFYCSSNVSYSYFSRNLKLNWELKLLAASLDYMPSNFVFYDWILNFVDRRDIFLSEPP